MLGLFGLIMVADTLTYPCDNIQYSLIHTHTHTHMQLQVKMGNLNKIRDCINVNILAVILYNILVYTILSIYCILQHILYSQNDVTGKMGRVQGFCLFLFLKLHASLQESR